MSMPRDKQAEFVESAVQLAGFLAQYVVGAVDGPPEALKTALPFLEPAASAPGPTPTSESEPVEVAEAVLVPEVLSADPTPPDWWDDETWEPRTINDLRTRFWSVVDITGAEETACWNWMRTLSPNGHGQFTKDTIAPGKVFYAHRVAWELTYGPVDASTRVYHTCDNRRCCRPDHLSLRVPTAVGQTKMSKDLVDDLQRRWEAGEFVNQTEAADAYGITRTTCNGYLTGRTQGRTTAVRQDVARAASAGRQQAMRTTQLMDEQIGQLLDMWEQGRFPSRRAAADAYGITVGYLGYLLRNGRKWRQKRAATLRDFEHHLTSGAGRLSLFSLRGRA
jgi:hypothetical protein